MTAPAPAPAPRRRNRPADIAKYRRKKYGGRSRVPATPRQQGQFRQGVREEERTARHEKLGYTVEGLVEQLGRGTGSLKGAEPTGPAEPSIAPGITGNVGAAASRTAKPQRDILSLPQQQTTITKQLFGKAPQTPPLRIQLTGGQKTPNLGHLPGAGTAVLVLGGSLALLAAWNDSIQPFIGNIWYGTPGNLASGKYKLAPYKLSWSGGLSLALFIALLVFVASTSPDAADVIVWLLMAMWAVYLVMNPEVVAKVAGWFGQGTGVPTASNPAKSVAKLSTSASSTSP